MKTFSRPRLLACSAVVVLSAVCPPGATAQTDEFAWLEDLDGDEAMAWVEARNAETLARLRADPRFNGIVNELVDLPPPVSRLTGYRLLNGDAYQVLEDNEHPRGLWRRTPFEALKAGEPRWETLLDVDALAEAEGVAWKLSPSPPNCLPPEYVRCLLGLSEGGSDAVVIREFDLNSQRFVDGGFSTDRPSRTWSTWVSPESILIAADVGEGSLTLAMYPRMLKLWSRGQTLEEAPVVLEAEQTELLGAIPVSYHMSTGMESFVSVIAGMSGGTLYHLAEGRRAVRLPLPEQFALPGLLGAVGDHLILQTTGDWSDGRHEVAAGSLIAFDFKKWLEDPSADAIHVIFAPTADRFLPAFLGTAVTSERVWFVALENISGRLFSAAPRGDGWTVQQADMPEHMTINLRTADPARDMALITVEGFLTSGETFALEAGESAGMLFKDEELFDASGYVVEQKYATSRDGTQIPYYLVRRDDLEFDGTSPTIQYAYGGFGLAMQPSYLSPLGGGDVLIPWLRAGGTYVLANIRGGGEFGPDWHQAGVLENRQTVYDDYFAVSEHLIETRVTSPSHLGIKGESNGGLLVSVALTQRPDLYGAVLAGVPLTDMLNYHTMLAGASWIDEYGSPEDPVMRQVLEAYSPYHNVPTGGSVPEAFYYGSKTDDRVHPGHARKMVARLMAAGHPALYHENTEGGHGAAVTARQAAELTALQAVYLMRKLGLRAPIS